jgi:glycosyltransferase involved in cell wall biosynthesis
MRILWVLDTIDSALSISAHSKSDLGGDYLYSDDFYSLNALTTAIAVNRSDIVVFCWRKVLRDITKSAKCSTILANLPPTTKIAILIPDCIGASRDGIESDLPLFTSADCILTTNRSLQAVYKEYFGHQKEVMVLADTVLAEREKLSKPALKKIPGQVIWVGNSKWGTRQGFKDHKGFQSVIKPLSDMCASSYCNHSYIFIDSALGRVKNRDVVNAISSSEYLLQASDSEGTGMPVLEALCMKTVPVTTKVGVAEEILTDELSFLVVQRDPKSFYSVLHDPQILQLVDSNRLTEAYRKHVSTDVLQVFEKILSLTSTRMSTVPRKSLNLRTLEYFLRFLRKRALN